MDVGICPSGWIKLILCTGDTVKRAMSSFAKPPMYSIRKILAVSVVFTKTLDEAPTAGNAPKAVANASGVRVATSKTSV